MGWWRFRVASKAATKTMPACPRRPPRARRWKRWQPSVIDKVLLQHSYASSRYPDVTELSSLAVLCGVEVRTIKVWFQNQRQRRPKASRAVDAFSHL